MIDQGQSNPEGCMYIIGSKQTSVNARIVDSRQPTQKKGAASRPQAVGDPEGSLPVHGLHSVPAGLFGSHDEIAVDAGGG